MHPPLAFSVLGAVPLAHAAAPILRFTLAVDAGGARIRSILLDTQLRIAAPGRRYDAGETERLFDLFGAPEGWGTTLQSVLWTRVTSVVPDFTGRAEVALDVPCTYDLDVTATRYFGALAGGEVPLELLFSGSVFYTAPTGMLQTARLSWEEEARLRLPVAVWRATLDRHFGGAPWLRVPADAYERLLAWRSGFLTWDEAVAALPAGEPDVDAVRAIADAVLYEGYVLWPYRRSALKNQRRWTFGGVFPPAWSARHPDDRAVVRAEVLVEGAPAVEVRVRFLQVVERAVRHDGVEVDELEHEGVRVLAWDEATERESGPGAIRVAAGEAIEPLGAAGAVVRRWRALEGRAAVAAAPAVAGTTRVTVELANTTPWAGGDREDALRHTFCSAHVVLRAVAGGAFVSACEPAAAACASDGLWPVLVGPPGSRDTVLASPFILDDHPRVAPESPGDFFDGGEVDGMLVLNILALTDAEKAEMRATDPRARALLERTEAMTPEDVLRLHGAWR